MYWAKQRASLAVLDRLLGDVARGGGDVLEAGLLHATAIARVHVGASRRSSLRELVAHGVCGR